MRCPGSRGTSAARPSGSSPKSRFAKVRVYVGVLHQRSVEGMEGGDRAFNRARDVGVIQKCIQILTRAEVGMGHPYRSVDANRKQSGH